MKQSKKIKGITEYRQNFKIMIILSAFSILIGFGFWTQPICCAQSILGEGAQNIEEKTGTDEVKVTALNQGMIIPDEIVSLTDYLTGEQTSNIYLGEYEQDNINDSLEGILWRVLENNAGTLFLLTDKNIDTLQYNQKYEIVSWWDCTIRKWLNSDFYQNAFSDSERTLIKPVKLSNPSNDVYGTNGGFDTDDNVFLLSITDVYNPTYGFTDDTSRMVINTLYTGARGATGKELGDGFWWLRSPGRTGGDALVVYYDGYTTDYGYNVDFATIGLRPAIYFDTTNVIMIMNSKTEKPNEIGNQLSEIVKPVTEKKENILEENEVTSYIPTLWNNKMLLSLEETKEIVLNIGSTEEERSLTYDYEAQTEIGIDNTYISAVIQDGATHSTLYYGKLKNITQKQDLKGTVTVTIPEQLEEGNYVLRLFLETCNNNQKTDYASDFVTIPVSMGTIKNLVSLESFEIIERMVDEEEPTFWEEQSPMQLTFLALIICILFVGIYVCIILILKKWKKKVSKVKKL